MVPDGLRAAGTTLGSPSAVHLWREALGLSQDLELGGDTGRTGSAGNGTLCKSRRFPK